MQFEELEPYLRQILTRIIQGDREAFVELAKIVEALFFKDQVACLCPADTLRIMSNVAIEVALAAGRLVSLPISSTEWLIVQVGRARGKWQEWIAFDRAASA